jgi:hypothetical protein
MRGAMLVALLALPFPASAGAQSATPRTTDARAGITVTGIGFAGTKAFAADHAIRDARERAAMVAVAIGVDIGGLESVEMPELTQFTHSPRSCRRAADQPPTLCRKAAAATVTFSILGGASGDVETIRAVTADDTASAPVEPRERTSDRWIKRALLTAREEATKWAAVAAWQNARTAAAAADLRLGPIISVTETAPSHAPFPPFFDLGFRDPLLGFYGPGAYCAITKRPVVRRDPETGQHRVVRLKRRRCVFPSTYETRLEVRYAVN